MEAIRRNLQARPKILKKLLEHQINQSERTFSQKHIFSTLKVWRSQNFVWELSDGVCRLDSKSWKNYRNIKLTNYYENFPKKSVKEPKFRMGANRWNLQAQPKILKKLSEHQIDQSERKFSQKKVCLVP
jgi:hypothetical protein